MEKVHSKKQALSVAVKARDYMLLCVKDEALKFMAYDGVIKGNNKTQYASLCSNFKNALYGKFAQRNIILSCA